jgi:hypothetical protein
MVKEWNWKGYNWIRKRKEKIHWSD